MQAPEINGFFSEEHITNPLPFLKRARHEYPVFRSKGGNGEEIFVVTRYADLKDVFARVDHFSNDYAHILRPPSNGKASEDGDIGFEYNKYGSFLLTEDDPVHARRRELVAAFFRAKSVNDLTPSIYTRCDRIIDAFIERGEADVIADLAAPMTLGTILHVLGFDESMVGRAYDWSLAAAMRISHNGTPEQEREGWRHIADMIEYLKQAVNDIRSGKPYDEGSISYQVISAKIDGQYLLDDEEAVSFMHELLFGGNETTRATIVAGVALLLRHPDQLALLREDRSLLDSAVEEVLRFHSTGSAIWRVAACDTQIAGYDIPAGSVLNLRMDSANRDVEIFDNPDAFDIRRAKSKVHLAFGYGVHHCVGNLLAKRETFVALDRVLDRLNNLSLVEELCDFDREPHVLAHSFKAMHIRFEPGTPLSDKKWVGQAS
jgi:cytochrome P450